MRQKQLRWERLRRLNSSSVCSSLRSMRPKHASKLPECWKAVYLPKHPASPKSTADREGGLVHKGGYDKEVRYIAEAQVFWVLTPRAEHLMALHIVRPFISPGSFTSILSFQVNVLMAITSLQVFCISIQEALSGIIRSRLDLVNGCWYIYIHTSLTKR